MAVHFYRLTVKQVKKETADCVSVSFDIPELLRAEFSYREGQNITIRTNINGEEVRRSYSLCTAPHENEWKVAVKKVAGGAFSIYANDTLKAGDVLEVMPPTGKFNAKNVKGNFLAIAAGSGITPVISIIKHILQSNESSNFTLIYGNRSRSSVIFFEEIEALKNKFISRFRTVNILSRERTDSAINYGRINFTKLQELAPIVDFKSFDDIFICGPEEMIFSAAEFLETAGIPKSNIHFELFTSPGQKKIIPVEENAEDNSKKSRVTVKLDGRAFEFDLAYESESILDAALKQGADLPFACKGGVCCTCRAKLTAGKVHMDVNYALEEEEVADGFILTCQSHPLTDTVAVDFDIK